MTAGLLCARRACGMQCEALALSPRKWRSVRISAHKMRMLLLLVATLLVRPSHPATAPAPPAPDARALLCLQTTS